MATDLQTPVEAPLPPMSSTGFFRWMWRQLTSMRTALILLFLLALASIPGSILPQRGTNPVLVDQWIAANPTTGPILDSLGFFDVFASPWFAAVYLLLFISLIGCVVPRLKVHWKAMRSQPPAAPRNLMRLGGEEFQVAQSPDQVLTRAQEYLKKNRWRVVRSGDDWVAAEKGYLRETGNLVFHFSFILVLIAIAYGGLFGWRGNVIIREGEGFSNTLTQYDAWGGGRMTSANDLPEFSFTLDEFNVEFERGNAQSGAPRLFEANVAVTRPGETQPNNELIEVNHPMVIDSAKVFLVGHGYAPVFRIHDSQGNLVFDDAVAFLPQDGNFTSTGVIKVPDGEPQLGFRGIFLPTSAVDEIRGPHSTFPAPDDPSVFMGAWFGDLGLDSGIPQSIYTLNVDAMEQMGLEALRPGEEWNLPGGKGTIEFTGFERWASFQIASDPGKEAALIGAFLAIAGLGLSLFVQRRRVWVKVSPASASDTDGQTTVQVAGIAKASGDDATESVEEIVAAVMGEQE